MLVDGKNIDQVAKSLGVTKNTFYRWKKEYGNLPVNQAKQMKDLEKENARLKKIVAENIIACGRKGTVKISG